jgi:hypothetical protein
MNDEAVKDGQDDKVEKINRGGRNLAVLGTLAVVVALISSIISVNIYYVTGDIFLDRSRPGFIFEDEKDEAGTGDASFKFSPDGGIEEGDLSEYLKEFDKVVEDIQNASGAFSPDALSDEALRITE